MSFRSSTGRRARPVLRSIAHLSLLVAVSILTSSAWRGVARASEYDLLLVPAGSFVQGDGVAVCGTVERPVTLTRDFYLGRTEITNARFLPVLQEALDRGWVRVEGSRVYDNLGSDQTILEMDVWNCEITFDGTTFGLRQAPYALQFAFPAGYDPMPHPVKKLTWYGAASFCDWLSLRDGLPPAYDHTTWRCNGGDPYGAVGYRLPTDAEWEYAAQFPDGRTHPWGEAGPTCNLANHRNGGNFCRGWSEASETHPDGVSALGFQDLGGNCGEWCNDWWACELEPGSQIDPAGPDSGPKKVLHGGGWFYTGVYTRCANRDADPPAFTYEAGGFRIARTAPPASSVSSDETSSSDRARAHHLRVIGSAVRSGEELRLAVDPPLTSPARISLLDASGRLAREYELEAGAREVTGSLAGLARGLYFARLRVVGGERAREDHVTAAGTRIVLVR